MKAFQCSRCVQLQQDDLSDKVFCPLLSRCLDIVINQTGSCAWRHLSRCRQNDNGMSDSDGKINISGISEESLLIKSQVFFEENFKKSDLIF